MLTTSSADRGASGDTLQPTLYSRGSNRIPYLSLNKKISSTVPNSPHICRSSSFVVFLGNCPTNTFRPPRLGWLIFFPCRVITFIPNPAKAGKFGKPGNIPGPSPIPIMFGIGAGGGACPANAEGSVAESSGLCTGASLEEEHQTYLIQSQVRSPHNEHAARWFVAG